MNYKAMSSTELLSLAATEKKHNKEINKVWYGRYGMNFPYRLDLSGAILNMLINAFVGDRECDHLILDQANRLRKKKGLDIKGL